MKKIYQLLIETKDHVTLLRKEVREIKLTCMKQPDVELPDFEDFPRNLDSEDDLKKLGEELKDIRYRCNMVRKN